MNSRFASVCIKAQEQKWFSFFCQIVQFFSHFLFQCLYADKCEPGVHSYQFYCVKSTFSPILKSLVPWGHLVGGYLSLCYTLCLDFHSCLTPNLTIYIFDSTAIWCYWLHSFSLGLLFLYTLILILIFLLKLGESTIVTLAVLSLQRLMTATNPEKYKLTSYRKSFLVISGIWCYILCISLAPFFGFGAFVVESSGVT